MKRKLVSLVLTLAMALSLLPAGAMAAKPSTTPTVRPATLTDGTEENPGGGHVTEYKADIKAKSDVSSETEEVDYIVTISGTALEMTTTPDEFGKFTALMAGFGLETPANTHYYVARAATLDSLTNLETGAEDDAGVQQVWKYWPDSQMVTTGDGKVYTNFYLQVPETELGNKTIYMSVRTAATKADEAAIYKVVYNMTKKTDVKVISDITATLDLDTKVEINATLPQAVLTGAKETANGGTAADMTTPENVLELVTTWTNADGDEVTTAAAAGDYTATVRAVLKNGTTGYELPVDTVVNVNEGATELKVTVAEDVKPVTVTFDVTAAEGVTVTDVSNTDSTASPYTVKDATKEVTFKLTVPDGKTAVVKIGADALEANADTGVYTIEAARLTADVTVTVTLKDEASEKVTVTFNVNKPSEATGDVTAPDAQEIDKGGVLTSVPTLKLDGYTFKGWAETAEGTVIADLATKTFDADATLYAIWEKEAVPATLTVALPTTEQATAIKTALGKEVSALQTNLAVDGMKVTGTSNYVKEFEGFSSYADEQQGNYIALVLTGKDAENNDVQVHVKSKHAVTGTPENPDGEGWKTLDDGILIRRITVTEGAINPIEVKLGEETTVREIDLTGLTLGLPPMPAPDNSKVDNTTGTVENDLSTEEAKTQVENDIKNTIANASTGNADSDSSDHVDASETDVNITFPANNTGADNGGSVKLDSSAVAALQNKGEDAAAASVKVSATVDTKVASVTLPAGALEKLDSNKTVEVSVNKVETTAAQEKVTAEEQKTLLGKATAVAAVEVAQDTDKPFADTELKGSSAIVIKIPVTTAGKYQALFIDAANKVLKKVGGEVTLDANGIMEIKVGHLSDYAVVPVEGNEDVLAGLESDVSTEPVIPQIRIGNPNLTIYPDFDKATGENGPWTGAATATIAAVDGQDNTYNVTVTATDLEKHNQKGDAATGSDAGYWIGFMIPYTEATDETDVYKQGWGDTVSGATFDDPDGIDSDSNMAGFYWNYTAEKETEDGKKGFLQVLASDGTTVKATYIVDFTGVTRKADAPAGTPTLTVAKAELTDAEVEQLGASSKDLGNYTVTTSAGNVTIGGTVNYVEMTKWNVAEELEGHYVALKVTSSVPQVTLLNRSAGAKDGKVITLPAVDSTADPVMYSDTVVVWLDGTQDIDLATKTFTITAADTVDSTKTTTLTVSFANATLAPEATGEFTITFNANKPTEAAGDVTGMPDEMTTSEGKITAPTAPALDGYTFKGWAEDADAAAADVVDLATKVFTADTELFAIWEKDTTGGVVTPEPSDDAEITDIETETKPDGTIVASGTVTAKGDKKVTGVKVTYKDATGTEITLDASKVTYEPATGKWTFEAPAGATDIKIAAVFETAPQAVKAVWEAVTETEENYYGGKLTITGLTDGTTYLVRLDNGRATGNTKPSACYVVKGDETGTAVLSCQGSMNLMIFEIAAGKTVNSKPTEADGSDVWTNIYYRVSGNNGTPVQSLKA